MSTLIAAIVSAAGGSLVTWIVHLFFPRTVTVPSTAPNPPVSTAAPIQAQPVIDLSTHAHAAALPPELVSLFKALETMNAPFILSEARALSALVAHYGGFAQLLDSAVNQILEARLASGDDVLLEKIAAAQGVTGRQLLDALEGKPGAAAAVISAKPAVAVAAPLIALALMLFGGSAALADFPLGPNFANGPSHWHADVHAPQRFYPTELNLIAEPKVHCSADGSCSDPAHNWTGHHAPQPSTGLVFGPDGRAYGPNGYYQPASYQSGNVGFWQRGAGRRIVSAPFRWFAHRRHFRLFGRRC